MDKILYYWELLCPIICILICSVHSVFEFLISRKLGMKINKLCDKCGMPVFDNSAHSCVLTEDQLNKVYDLVQSLKEGGSDDGFVN